MLSPFHPEIGMKVIFMGLPVSNLLEVGEDPTLSFLVSGFGIIEGLVVHLVAGSTHLLDTKNEGKKGVLSLTDAEGGR
jgi:hypothetical protein